MKPGIKVSTKKETHKYAKYLYINNLENKLKKKKTITVNLIKA